MEKLVEPARDQAMSRQCKNHALSRIYLQQNLVVATYIYLFERGFLSLAAKRLVIATQRINNSLMEQGIIFCV